MRYVRPSSRSDRPEPIPWVAMELNDDNMFIASSDVDAALAISTVIDGEEFDAARLDRRWREFCLNSEQYVAEATRPRPQVRQTA